MVQDGRSVPGGWTTMRVGIGVAAALLATSSCSGEDIAERIAENRIESETGEDVDIDFSDGEIRVETDEGTLEMTTDEDGNVSIQAEGDDGEFSIDSEDGVTVMETEDGTATLTDGGGELPEGFPSEIPLPDGIDIQLAQTMDAGGDQQGWLVVAEADGGWESYADEFVTALEDAGFEQQQLTTTPTGVVASYVRDGLMVFGSITEGGTPDVTTFSIQAGTDG